MTPLTPAPVGDVMTRCCPASPGSLKSVTFPMASTEPQMTSSSPEMVMSGSFSQENHATGASFLMRRSNSPVELWVALGHTIWLGLTLPSGST